HGCHPICPSARHEAALARSPHGPSADQGRCRCTCQQNRTHGLGHDGARRALQGAEVVAGGLAVSTGKVIGNWRGHNDVMQTRSFRGSGEPAWVIASSNACEGLGPDPRRALGPAAIRAASTGRTHDRTRPMLHQRKKALVNQAPSTHDAKDGKELWKSKAAEWKEGFSLTVAPLVANGVLVTGISGAEFGIRGFIDGWDTETGKHLWRRYTIPARGEKGNETWPQNNNAWEVGGGSAWITGSYDPELDLMYWGIGNPAPWASQSRDGDNLYTSSVLAMRPTTGEIVWHYQFTPNDAYDYDACW